MLTSLRERPSQAAFGGTHELNCLGVHWTRLLHGFRHSLSLVRISIGDDLGRLSLRILDNLDFYQLGFGHDLVVLHFRLGVDRVDHGLSFSRPIGSYFLGSGLDGVNLSLLLELLQFGLLLLVLPLLLVQ